jgi:HemY protein
MYCELFHASKNQSLKEIQSIWNEVPRSVRKNPEVVCSYVKQLLQFSDTKDAEELIRKTLKNAWQPELARLYGTLPFVNLNRQLVIVGAWLKMYGEKQELLLTLGRLCVRVQLWGKAKDYFERCLALGPNREASLAYGRLLLQLEESEEALLAFQNGLDQAVQSV